MKRIYTLVVALGFLVLSIPVLPVHAQEEKTDSQPVTSSEIEEGKIHKLKDMVVKEESGAEGIKVNPDKTTIELDEFSMVGDKNNIQDLLKTQAIFDFSK